MNNNGKTCDRPEKSIFTLSYNKKELFITDFGKDHIVNKQVTYK